MLPYLIISDPHYHAFSAFARETAGINSRLLITIGSTIRAAMALKARGGKKIIFTGDVFHQRGKIAPTVLNPVRDMFKKLVAAGFEVHVIPGNHDLEKNDSVRAGNSVTALEDEGVKVYHESDMFQMMAFFPWFHDRDKLLRHMEGFALADVDAFIHAPVDGVLPHLPGGGLDPEVLGALGYNRVFAGHYHNYKDFGNGVYSVFINNLPAVE